jgi:hypothetical protein
MALILAPATSFILTGQFRELGNVITVCNVLGVVSGKSGAGNREFNIVLF